MKERTDPRLVGGLVALIVLALIVIAVFHRADASFVSKHGDIGTIDFIQYWSAHQLLMSGQNPYDPALLYAVEVAQGLPDATPIMMWNPPWLVTFLAPVLSFDFLQACTLWLGVNLVLMALTGILVSATYLPGVRPEPLVIVAMFLFEPHISTLRFGQLGILYAVSVAAFLYGVRRNDAALMGLALVPLSVKPHLFYLAFVFLAYWVLVERRWKVVAWALGGFGVLVVATLLQYPAALAQWVRAFDTPPMQWAVATLVGMTRQIVFQLTREVPSWPLVVIPGLTTAGFVLWLALRRPRPDVIWRLPAILALSLFTAPYGWVFDQAQLVVIQVGLVALLMRPLMPPHVRLPLLALLLVQVSMEAQNLAGFDEHLHYFWTTAALGTIWVWGLRRAEIADPFARHSVPVSAQAK
jgi:hypothetical protein